MASDTPAVAVGAHTHEGGGQALVCESGGQCGGAPRFPSGPWPPRGPAPCLPPGVDVALLAVRGRPDRRPAGSPRARTSWRDQGAGRRVVGPTPRALAQCCAPPALQSANLQGLTAATFSLCQVGHLFLGQTVPHPLREKGPGGGSWATVGRGPWSSGTPRVAVPSAGGCGVLLWAVPFLCPVRSPSASCVTPHIPAVLGSPRSGLPAPSPYTRCPLLSLGSAAPGLRPPPPCGGAE